MMMTILKVPECHEHAKVSCNGCVESTGVTLHAATISKTDREARNEKNETRVRNHACGRYEFYSTRCDLHGISRGQRPRKIHVQNTPQ